MKAEELPPVVQRKNRRFYVSRPKAPRLLTWVAQCELTQESLRALGKRWGGKLGEGEI